MTAAIEETSRCRNAVNRAPLVVSAAGAPACVMAATISVSPVTPETKLPDVQAYAVTTGATACRLADAWAKRLGLET